jgi:glucose-6-phosphate isomerase
MPGNRPTNVLLAEKLTPAARRSSLYEHSVFTQGTIWSVDLRPVGAELGEGASVRSCPSWRTPEPDLKHDSSTAR